MLSLLYISRSRLPGGTSATEVQAILDTASRRNRERGITGGLIFTGRDFAQVLEGPEDSVAAIMANILIDSRHEDVRIVRREGIDKRSFPNWGMALISHDPATAAHIERIRSARDDAELAEAIEGVMDWMQQGHRKVDV